MAARSIGAIQVDGRAIGAVQVAAGGGGGATIPIMFNHYQNLRAA